MLIRTIPGLETVTGTLSRDTHDQANQAAGVRKVGESMDEWQALEQRKTPPDLTPGVLALLHRLQR